MVLFFFFKYTTLVVKVFNLLNHSYYHPGQEQGDAGNNFFLYRSEGYRKFYSTNPPADTSHLPLNFEF